MNWRKVCSIMDQREEFVALASSGLTPIRQLCKRFEISPPTGYKWLRRAQEAGEDDGDQWACDRSRRPLSCPWQTREEVEALVLGVRREHPAWGARKIKRRLEDLGHKGLPSASTITAILQRHGQISPEESKARQAFVRFEHEEPNLLWQMDFKGPVRTRHGTCHPLTVVDDHSRYALCVKALANEQGPGVKRALTEIFQLYGLPHRILSDNGACWGAAGSSRWPKLAVWLTRLGVGLTHGRFYHPQTQGKNERFNRTLKAEALGERTFVDLEECQRAFDHMRRVYNEQRPHEALGMATPATRYAVSTVEFPRKLPPIEYLSEDIVRVVTKAGTVSYQSRFYVIGRGFVGEPVALRATNKDGFYEVYYCSTRVGSINLHRPQYTKYQRKDNRSGDESRPQNNAGRET